MRCGDVGALGEKVTVRSDQSWFHCFPTQMEVNQPPSAPNLSPVQVLYKKNASKEPKIALLDEKKGFLRFQLAQSNNASNEASESSLIDLASSMTTTVRSRPGNEFTLVLKFRLSADSPTQKELWLDQLSALGIHVRC